MGSLPPDAERQLNAMFDEVMDEYRLATEMMERGDLVEARARNAYAKQVHAEAKALLATFAY